MKMKNKKNRNGFTLVETLVAVLVFSLTAVMLSGAFSGFLKTYNEAKRIQKGVESAQYALNLMAKTIRTSFVQKGSLPAVLDATNPRYYSWPLNLYDYSQGLCVQYNLVNNPSTGMNKLQMGTINPTISGDPSTCSYGVGMNINDVTSEDIKSGFLNYLPSNTSSATPYYGLVTISLHVKEPGQTSGEVPIQTTVSLRQ